MMRRRATMAPPTACAAACCCPAPTGCCSAALTSAAPPAPGGRASSGTRISKVLTIVFCVQAFRERTWQTRKQQKAHIVRWKSRGAVALCVTVGLEHFRMLAERSCGQQNPGGARGGGSEGWAHTSVMTQGSFVSSPTRGFSACACAE